VYENDGEKINKSIYSLWVFIFVEKDKFTPPPPIPYRPFSRMFDKNFVFLYAGDIPETTEYSRFDMLGLSLTRSDKRHIRHNMCY
jgi:hypothetical protein